MANPPLHRIVRYVNLVIAAVLLIALAVVYWFAWRPLPKTSGSISVPVSQAVTVVRDRLGVPHITAAAEQDALFAQGYTTAQDRLFQMDGLRRLAGGTLAEVFGPSLLESDREARRLRLRRIAENAYVAMPPADRAVMAAYARGVNAFISTHLNSPPVEFTLLKYDPRPWSVVDSILIGLHMYRTLTTSYRDELIKRSMLAGGDRAKVDYLFPTRGASELQPGSNAWVLAGSRTASGRPLLSNDMHLEWSLPGIWYMVHLRAGELDAAGVSLPGVPGVIVGHNQRIAWGFTNLQFDVQDLYVEKFDDRTGRYLFRGQVEQARADREVIRVRGGRDEEETIWVTRHGPVFPGEGNERLALRWVAAEPGAFTFPILDLDRARNWQQFITALARFEGPAQNVVYADTDGNIGYQAFGKLPRRRGWNGDLPVDGASGNYEWDGFMPFEQLPSNFNPASGMIVTANQNPFPPDYPGAVHGNFASPYRARQIRDMLASRKAWRATDMLKVQKDVYSGFSRYLAQSIVAAYDRRKAHNPALDDAIAALRAWNGQMEKDEAAPLVIALAFQHLRKAVGDCAAPGKGLLYEHHAAAEVIEQLLRTRPPGWFPDYDLMLLRVLSDALEEGRRILGRPVPQWQYGNYLHLTLTNPVLHNVPLVGKYFDIGPIPMSGSTTTVKQTSHRLGPSMRMTADLGDWQRSYLNILSGQSGQALSSHYKDQWDAYYYATSFPMQYGKVEAKSVLRLVPENGQ